MYRLPFASVQMHVFRKSLICIQPLYRLVVCRGLQAATGQARHASFGSASSLVAIESFYAKPQ